MGASNSIQFRGKQQVIQAFENRGCDIWAVFQGKTLLNKGEGIDELDAYLDLVSQNDSAAIYILKIYEDLESKKQVKEKTEADGSFYFRLHERDELTGERFGYNERRHKELEEKMNLILARLDQDEEEPEPEEQPNSIGSIINGILTDPERLEKMIGIVKNLITPSQALPAPHIGNVNVLSGQDSASLSPSNFQPMNQQQQTTQTQSMSEEQKLQRLALAIDTLEKFDSDLVPHLEKLAKIAATNPAQFKTLISMLDVF